jgi:hypothetical protein
MELIHDVGFLRASVCFLLLLLGLLYLISPKRTVPGWAYGVVDKTLAPTSSSNLTLTADNRPQEAMRINSDGAWGIGVSAPQPEHQNRVAMSVGKDNRLWLQVDGEWRRVALEG